MPHLKYQDYIPIKLRTYKVWVARFPNGEQKITIWAIDATIETVHHFYETRYDKFWLGIPRVGEWVAGEYIYSYIDDGRYIDRDWNVSIKPQGHQQ